MSDWTIARLEDCTEIVSGATPSTSDSAYWDGDICWATPKDLSELEGAYISDTRRKITRSGLQSCAATVLPPDSVLFSSRAPIGYVAINTVSMATNQGFKSFVPKRELVNSKFLYHWLRCNRTYLESLGNGATFKEISKAVVARIEIPLPPLPEQQRIAAILDMADELRAKRRAAIANLDILSQSIFLDMFGERASRHWRTTSVASVAKVADGSIRTGPFGSQLLHSEFTDSGVAVLGIDNVVQNDFRWGQRRYISEEKYDELRRYTVHPGDVLISIMGTCGRCAIVPDDIPTAINTKHLCCITLDRNKCLPEFLHAYFLRHPVARRYLNSKAKGAIMAGLNMGIIKNLPIPSVPLELQQRFVNQAAELKRIGAAQKRHEAGLTETFTSIQNRAFRGGL